MALKLRKGRHTRAYPLRDELLAFGREVCGVQAPEQVIEAVCSAMSEVMHQHRSDERIAPELRDKFFSEWVRGVSAAHTLDFVEHGAVGQSRPAQFSPLAPPTA